MGDFELLEQDKEGARSKVDVITNYLDRMRKRSRTIPTSPSTTPSASEHGDDKSDGQYNGPYEDSEHEAGDDISKGGGPMMMPPIRVE
jgi:hypothetical protein